MRPSRTTIVLAIILATQHFAEAAFAQATKPGEWVYAIRETAFQPNSDEPAISMPLGTGVQVCKAGETLEVMAGAIRGTIAAGDFKPATEALSHFTTLVEKAPDDMSLRLVRAKVAGSANDWKTAIADFTHLIRHDPNRAHFFGARAMAHYAIGDFDQAIGDCNEAIRLNARSFQSYLVRADSYRDLNEPLKALAGYDEALLHCDDAQGRRAILMRRGQLHFALYNLDEAMGDFTRAVEMKPQVAAAYVGRGRTLFFLGRIDDALSDFSKAIECDPADANAVFYRADLYRKKKDFQRAQADYTRAFTLAPNDPTILLSQANCYRDQGDHESAMSICSRVLEMQPTMAIAYSTRGLTWKEMGESEKAIADFRHAIKLDSKNVLAHNALAWALATSPDEKLRDGNAAVVHAKLACEATKSQIPNMLDTLAAAYAEAGKFELAMEHQRKALDRLTDEAEKADSRRRLELYQQGKPYRDN